MEWVTFFGRFKTFGTQSESINLVPEERRSLDDYCETLQVIEP